MSAHADPWDEWLELTRGLRAHLECQADSGATGVPEAAPELRSERGELDWSRVPDAPSPVARAGGTSGPESAPAARATELGEGPPGNGPPGKGPSGKGLARRDPAPEPLTLHSEERRSAEPIVAVRLGEAQPPPSIPRRDVRAASGPISEDVQRRLTVLAEEVSGCTRCDLHRERTQTVFARGTGSSGLCFVGEGPGADEDAQGEPFVGKAGQLLDRMIHAMGFDRDEVYVCNIVKCRPPDNRKPAPEEMAACSSYLEAQLDLVQPEVIVALGATAVQGLLGTTEGITRIRGRWRLYRGKIAVMPTFHPAYLLRTPNAKRDVWEDLKAVLQHMGRTPPSK